ncbi:hypothetical protein GALL_255880 [mine drainage metagenome]|uniref:Uncharacterized protein n=1 Tax=mine drainage metagenome TaxID=410659 RepID=A0A1J5RAW8_9ZZZZ
MMKEHNPWIDRFGPGLTEDQIRERVRVDARPLEGLAKLPAEQAVTALGECLSQVFVPTAQVISALTGFIGMARAYSASAFPSMGRYIRQIYQSQSGQACRLPTCLTGLAGVGKSELLKALAKVMPADMELNVQGHAGLQATSLLSFVMQSQVGAPGVLRQRTAQGWADLPRGGLNAHNIYRDGVSLMTADEFQAVTAGGSANAVATKTLMQMAQIGPPLVYCANYSLVHSLLKRPQQDRQRLLSNAVVIHPEAADSDDWRLTLTELQKVASRVIRIDPERDAADIHSYTAGIKRSVIALLSTAYRLARASGKDHFGMTDIQQAYASADFWTHRNDVEELTRQAIGNGSRGRRAALDLVCPFPGARQPQRVVVANKMVESYEDRLNEEHLRSSLTRDEREGLEALTVKPPARKSSASVARLPKRGSRRDELLAGQAEFLKSLRR